MTLSFIEEKMKTTRVKDSQRFQTCNRPLEVISPCEKPRESIQQRNINRDWRYLHLQAQKAAGAAHHNLEMLLVDAVSWQTAGKQQAESRRGLRATEMCTGIEENG